MQGVGSEKNWHHNTISTHFKYIKCEQIPGRTFHEKLMIFFVGASYSWNMRGKEFYVKSSEGYQQQCKVTTFTTEAKIGTISVIGKSIFYWFLKKLLEKCWIAIQRNKVGNTVNGYHITNYYLEPFSPTIPIPLYWNVTVKMHTTLTGSKF